MGGMGFSILLPCVKYSCAKIIVLNNDGTTKMVSDIFFPFLEKKILFTHH